MDIIWAAVKMNGGKWRENNVLDSFLEVLPLKNAVTISQMCCG